MKQIITSLIKRIIWCHICKKEFSTQESESEEIFCPFCKENFCEEVELGLSHPSAFIPYHFNEKVDF